MGAKLFTDEDETRLPSHGATDTHTFPWESILMPIGLAATDKDHTIELPLSRAYERVGMRKLVYVCRKCSATVKEDCRTLCGIGATHIDAWEIEVLSAGSDEEGFDSDNDTACTRGGIDSSPNLAVADFFGGPVLLKGAADTSPSDYYIQVQTFETLSSQLQTSDFSQTPQITKPEQFSVTARDRLCGRIPSSLIRSANETRSSFSPPVRLRNATLLPTARVPNEIDQRQGADAKKEEDRNKFYSLEVGDQKTNYHNSYGESGVRRSVLTSDSSGCSCNGQSQLAEVGMRRNETAVSTSPSLSDRLYGLQCFKPSRMGKTTDSVHGAVATEDIIIGRELTYVSSEDEDETNRTYSQTESSNTEFGPLSSAASSHSFTATNQIIKQNQRLLFHSGVAKWPFRDR